MATSLEVELTYLAGFIPEGLELAEAQSLVDIYVPKSREFPSLRIRRSGDRYELTKKQALQEGDLSAHYEHTITLDESEYNALCKSSNRRISKKRFYLPFNEHTAEVDVFDDELNGLVLIDFEFSSAEDARIFNPPDYCLANVTQEPLVLGSYLAGKTYTDIEAVLKKHSYKPLFLSTFLA